MWDPASRAFPIHMTEVCIVVRLSPRLRSQMASPLCACSSTCKMGTMRFLLHRTGAAGGGGEVKYENICKMLSTPGNQLTLSKC